MINRATSRQFTEWQYTFSEEKYPEGGILSERYIGAMEVISDESVEISGSYDGESVIFEPRRYFSG
jgi:hypothetical protein